MKTKFILALAAGFAAVASVQAATTVTTYTAGSQPTSVTIGNGVGWISLSTSSPAMLGFVTGSTAGNIVFTDGADLPSGGTFYTTHAGVSFNYYNDSENSDYFTWGAQAGDANYALLDLDGDDFHETVGQFHFGLLGAPNYVLALATSSDGSALSISAGKSAIEAGGTSAVPEVSGHLALLSLGSAGVLTRRRLKRAA